MGEGSRNAIAPSLIRANTAAGSLCGMSKEQQPYALMFGEARAAAA
jgi:hypothetical protein